MQYKKVFRATVDIAKNLYLIGGIFLAGDGTKLRAQNSKKNNYNQKKIDRHIAYIEKKLSQYVEELQKADGDKKNKFKTKSISTTNKRKNIKNSKTIPVRPHKLLKLMVIGIKKVI